MIATERTVTAGKCFFRYLALQGPGFLVGSDGEESACNEDVGSIPGLGNPLQYSCLENSTDRDAWQAIVTGSQRVGHN